MSEYSLVTYRGKFALAYNDADRGRVRISTGTNDRGAAEAIASEIWRRKTAAPSERVEDLWALYIADRRSEVSDPARIEDAWKSLGPHFGRKIGNALTPDDCRDYSRIRQALGFRPSTVRTELEYLRACINMRYGKGTVKLWTPPASAPRDRYLTPGERDRLLDCIKTPHVKLFVILALSTGGRMGAILDLQWEQIDFKHGTINLNPAGRHQTDKRRTIVPMNSRARVALEEAHRAAMTDHVIEYAGDRVVSVKKAIRSAAIRSGVPCSPHVFRHTTGVYMAQADVPMQKISQFLGHTSTRVTERIYARYSPSFMKDASAALDW